MRHAVILYAGREGSSAIVAHLGRHPQVVVPLFEQLDLYMLEREVPRADREHLPWALRRTLRAGRYAPSWFAPEAAGMPAPDPGGRRSLFKWRGWRLDEAVAEALAAEGAGLFLLNRRDLLNLNLSLYFTRHVIGGGVLRHPQFEILSLPPEQREGYRAGLQRQRFAVDVAALAAEMRGQVASKRRILGAMAGFAARGVRLVPLWYEDFLAAPEPFLAGMLAALDLPWHAAVRESEYVEMSRPDLREQVENLAELEAAPEVRSLLEEWAEVAAGYAVLAPGGELPQSRGQG
jgi:hypothetical protein